MKKAVAAILCLMMILSVAACGGGDAKAEPAQRAKVWMQTQINNNTLFSFTYDGAPYAEHIKAWEKKTEQTDEGWLVTYQRQGVTFTVTVLFDEEHAALDWVGEFACEGADKSGVIGKVMILDADFAIEGAVMTTANQGGDEGIDDYQAYQTDLVETKSYLIKNKGGVSSYGGWPWFDLTSADNSYGIMGAIGWSGNWQAQFDYAEGAAHISAGMQATNYYMLPGETLRTPRMVIQFFDGTQDDGHNDWRALILDNYNPKTPSGEPVKYAPITFNTWGGRGSDALVALMKEVLATDQYFEYQWIDAGWYGDYTCMSTYDNEWRTQLGNWYYNPGYDGVGFSELKALAQENDYGLLVWFEPGRALMGSQLYREHPEFFLPNPSTQQTDSSHAYIDYGNEAARKHMTEMVLGFLDDMGSNFYRQDYNFNPAEHWDRQDKVLDASGNRCGVSEIRYITGHYEFLDAIIASGRQIDNCASGGRMIDIEMTKRSIPLWRTDYTVSGKDVQTVASGIYSQGAGLSWWVVHSGGNGSTEGVTSEYGFRAFMASGCTGGVIHQDRTFAKKMFDELLHNREYMLHDFYIITQGYGSDTNYKNAGYEYHIPEEGRGYLVCFRPSGSGEQFTVFKLRGLEADATYVIRNADNGETHEFTGKQLMEQGMQVEFPRAGVSHMIYFDKK